MEVTILLQNVGLGQSQTMRSHHNALPNPRRGLPSRAIFDAGLIDRRCATYLVTAFTFPGGVPCDDTLGRYRGAEKRDELAALHVWMAPAWQEITSRAAQKSLAVMCPACSRSPDGLLALMGSANRGLIIRAGSMSR